MRAHDYPLVVEFLVIVSMINKVVAIEVLVLLGRGVLSICYVSTSSPGLYLCDIAFDLNLYKPDRETPVVLVISSCGIFSSNLVRAISLAPTELPLILSEEGAASSRGSEGSSKGAKVGEERAESGGVTSSGPESLSYESHSSSIELSKSKRSLQGSEVSISKRLAIVKVWY